MSIIVLNNAALNDAASYSTQQEKVAVWAVEGSCVVSFEDAYLTTLKPGEFKRIAIGAGSVLSFDALEDNTTVKLKSIRENHTV